MLVYAPNYEKMFNPEKHLYFAMLDKGINKRIENIEYEMLAHYNFEEYGVFQTIHKFNSNERKSNNIKNILFWAVDLDDGSKKQMMATIKKGLKPSYIVETKKGYHVYWKAENATFENYAAIMEKLIFFYKADQQAKDLARILRVAGYNHWKQEKPFLCKELFYSKRIYLEEEIIDWCKKIKLPKPNYNRNYNYYEKSDNVYAPNRCVGKGERNAFLNRYGYILKTKNGIIGDTLEAMMLDYNNKFVKPPLPENEVIQIYRSVENARV